MLVTAERPYKLKRKSHVGRALRPKPSNGEEDLAKALNRLRINWTYEVEEYELGGIGFRPDFNLAPCRHWPAINVELTWADKGLGTKRHQESMACLKRKSWKIRQVREIYGIRTVLITHKEWKRIMSHHRYLLELIERELAREVPA